MIHIFLPCFTNTKYCSTAACLCFLPGFFFVFSLFSSSSSIYSFSSSAKDDICRMHIRLMSSSTCQQLKVSEETTAVSDKISWYDSISRPSQAADDDLLGTPDTKTTVVYFVYYFYLDGLPSEAETITVMVVMT